MVISVTSLVELFGKEFNNKNPLTKRDLEEHGHEYSWEADRGDDEHEKRLDSFELSRKEGYEVLYFINKMASELGIEDKKIAFKIEELIHDAPKNFESTAHIEKWVLDRLKEFIELKGKMTNELQNRFKALLDELLEKTKKAD